MSERPPEADENPMPDDIAALYARAHLPGTRYWDFSASRHEVQGQFRNRIAREHAERAAAGSAASASGFVRPYNIQTNARPFPSSPPDAGNTAPERIGPILTPNPGVATPGGLQPRTMDPQILKPQPLEQESAASNEPAGANQDPYPIDEPMTSRSAPHAVPPPRREPPPQPSEETRWYALHSLFEPQKVRVEPPRSVPEGWEQSPPVLAVVSLAGGVGKTCVVATLGRALSAAGENVLLADTNAAGLLPFYYGARIAKPGVVRTFSPPGAPSRRSDGGVPVRLLSLVPERDWGDQNDYDPLLARLVRNARGVSRVLVDVATANRDLVSRLLCLRPTVLVPLLPDFNSVASLAPLEALFANQKCFYLLNQFDSSSALHLEVNAILQQRLGDSLLPLVMRRDSAVSESLAEGLTVIDYAHDATVAEDYRQLAGWLRNFAAPAAVAAGGVRWSEG